jgi:flagellar motility protein MotE (MotC chaperone)
MKFILVPLLIVGMFISFGAALLAMLFWDGSVNSIEGVKNLLLKTTDSTQLSDDFILTEDKLDGLHRQAEDYHNRYEALRTTLAAREDSLANEARQAEENTVGLIEREKKLGLLEETQADSARAAAIENLAKYYSAVKPAVAAEALQADELNEAEVASILSKLTPAKAGKIMGFMDPGMVARITKTIMDAKP